MWSVGVLIFLYDAAFMWTSRIGNCLQLIYLNRSFNRASKLNQIMDLEATKNSVE